MKLVYCAVIALVSGVSLCLRGADTEKSATVISTAETKSSAQQIVQELRAFNTLGSVLHIGAHPDDENTQLVAYLARGRSFRTAYLSLTRGDGGQNELGPEFGDKLGFARTEELLAARRIDGGEQYFTRAIDFGFSKSPEETLRIWDRQQVLADVVRVIRQFCPDVIVTRFPIPPGSGGHGHHTASAILAVEAFKLAGDPRAFPEQLNEGLKPWQAKRILWNAWSPNRQGPAPAGLKIDIGGADPVTGESFASIAALSRAMHRTQGFGNFASRAGNAPTPHEEIFVLLGGEPAQNDIMDGVQTSWSRFDGGAAIDEAMAAVQAQFDPKNPSVSVPALLKVRAQLDGLTASGEAAASSVLIAYKQRQLTQILQRCLGIEVSTSVPNALVVPGEPLHQTFRATIHSSVPVEWLDVTTPTGLLVAHERRLEDGREAELSYPANDERDRLPKNRPVTQPYWLREDAGPGLFRVSDFSLIGRPEDPPVWPVSYRFKLNDGSILAVNDEAVQRRVGVPVAQLRQAVVAIPPVSMRFVAAVSLFHANETREVAIQLTAARAETSGELELVLPKAWRAERAHQAFSLARVGEQTQIIFRVTAPKDPASALLHVQAKVGSSLFDSDRLEINYPHLPLLILQSRAEARVASFPFAIRGHLVGYIAGAGDATVDALEQLGYSVETLKIADLNTTNLQRFDTIVVGVRAFNVHEDLSTEMPKLITYIQKGGTVVEQYNRPNGLAKEQLGPYPFSIQGDAPGLRVTDENSPVAFLAKDHVALTTPNRITAADFNNWVQERGAYFPSSWDEHYTPILAMNDPGEAPLRSGILIAQLGRGYFVYTSLAFFRQLPAGNPGAYRLWANLVSLGK